MPGGFVLFFMSATPRDTFNKLLKHQFWFHENYKLANIPRCSVNSSSHTLLSGSNGYVPKQLANESSSSLQKVPCKKYFNPLKSHQIHLDYKWCLHIVPVNNFYCNIINPSAVKVNFQSQNSLVVRKFKIKNAAVVLHAVWERFFTHFSWQICSGFFR